MNSVYYLDHKTYLDNCEPMILHIDTSMIAQSKSLVPLIPSVSRNVRQEQFNDFRLKANNYWCGKRYNERCHNYRVWTNIRSAFFNNPIVSQWCDNMWNLFKYLNLNDEKYTNDAEIWTYLIDNVVQEVQITPPTIPLTNNLWTF